TGLDNAALHTRRTARLRAERNACSYAYRTERWKKRPLVAAFSFENPQASTGPVENCLRFRRRFLCGRLVPGLVGSGLRLLGGCLLLGAGPLGGSLEGCTHHLGSRLRWKLATLRDDERLHVDRDVCEELDRHLVAADLLDRIAEPDLAPVDAHLRDPPDLVGQVGRRHRAEQRARRPCL